MEACNTMTTSEYLPARSTPRAWLVCLTASLFFFYEFVQMMMFNAVNPSLMAAFHVTATSVGMLSSAYFIANIIFMFPAGILLDRFSTRTIILIAMVICLAGTLLFSFATNIQTAVVARFLTGIGGSFPFLCCLRLASRWFPARRMALVSGSIITVAFLGGAAGQAPMTWLIELTSWRSALRVDALLGVVFIALIFYFVQDCPEDFKQVVRQKAKQLNVKTMIFSTFKNRHTWLWGFYISTLNLSVMLLGAIWGGLYLTQVYGMSKPEASYITSMIFFGTIVGSPLMGYLSDKIGRRKLPAITFSIMSLLTLMLIVYVSTWTTPTLFILFLALGFFTSAQVIGYPAISEGVSHEAAGSALGMASVCIMLLPAITQPLFGWLMDLTWNGAKVNHVPIYSVGDFHNGLMILVVTCVISIALVALTKETYCQSSLKRSSSAEV